METIKNMPFKTTVATIIGLVVFVFTASAGYTIAITKPISELEKHQIKTVEIEKDVSNNTEEIKVVKEKCQKNEVQYATILEKIKGLEKLITRAIGN